MKIPDEIFAKIKARLWAQADRDGWMSLGAQQKSAFYEHWSREKEVGVVLESFMDKADVRVYIKDTIMKPYPRARTSNAAPVMQALGLSATELSIKEFEKPHGLLLFNHRIICWGQAKEWKGVLLAVWERAYRESGKTFAAVLFRPVGKMAQPSERAIVEALAKDLGIERIVWAD